MKARGGSRLKGLIALAIVAVLFVAGFRLIPLYLHVYEFRDAMRSQARLFGDWPPKTYEVVHEELCMKARDLNLPISREQIRVSSGPGGISIAARFSVPVDLFAFQHELNSI